MTETPHREVAALYERYRRELQESAPSKNLDARIARLVAGVQKKSLPARQSLNRLQLWAAAAGVAAVAIAAGILIGMNIERTAPAAGLAQDDHLLPADFSLWPTDSVALQIPAEVSTQGTLVAVGPNAESSGKRYWIDVVVSNDGTIRIDRIVPAEKDDEVRLQTQ